MIFSDILFLQVVPTPEDGKLWLWIITILCAVIIFLFPLLWSTKTTSHKENLATQKLMFEEMKKAKDVEIDRLKKAKETEIERQQKATDVEIGRLVKSHSAEKERLNRDNETLTKQNNQMVLEVISQSKYVGKTIEASNVMIERVLNLLHEIRSNGK